MRGLALLVLVASGCLMATPASAAVYTINDATFDPTKNYSDQPQDDNKKMCAVTSGGFWLCRFTVLDNQGNSNAYFVTADVTIPATHTDGKLIRVVFEPSSRVNIGDGQTLTFDGPELVMDSHGQTEIHFVATNGVGSGTVRFRGAIQTYNDEAGSVANFGIDTVTAISVRMVFEDVTALGGGPFLARTLLVRNIVADTKGLDVSGSKLDINGLRIAEGVLNGSDMVGAHIHSASQVSVTNLEVVGLSASANNGGGSTTAVLVENASLSVDGGKIQFNHGSQTFIGIMAKLSTLGAIDGLVLSSNTSGANAPLHGVVIDDSMASLSTMKIVGELNGAGLKKSYDSAVRVLAPTLNSQITVKNSSISGASFGVHLIDINIAATITGNVFSAMGNRALFQNSSSGSTPDLLFENNLIKSPATGDWLVYVRKGIVRFNTIDCNNTAGWGIYSASFSGTDLVEITGNVVLRCTGANILFHNNPGDPTYKDRVRFNIAFGNTVGCNYNNGWNGTGCLSSGSLPSQHGPNFDVNPLLDVNYRPQATTPLVLFNAVDPGAITTPSHDLDGRPRIGFADIGAYEVPLLTSVSPGQLTQGQSNALLTVTGLNLPAGIEATILYTNSTDTSLQPNPLLNQTPAADGKGVTLTLTQIDQSAPLGVRDLQLTLYKGANQQVTLSKTSAFSIVAGPPPSDVIDAGSADTVDAGATDTVGTADTGAVDSTPGKDAMDSMAGADSQASDSQSDVQASSDLSETTPGADVPPSSDAQDSVSPTDSGGADVAPATDQSLADSAPSSDLSLGDTTLGGPDVAPTIDAGADGQTTADLLPSPDALQVLDTVATDLVPFGNSGDSTGTPSADTTDTGSGDGTGGSKGDVSGKSGGCISVPAAPSSPGIWLLVGGLLLLWRRRRLWTDAGRD